MHPNLIDHLTAFIAVAETASFSEAARRLGPGCLDDQLFGDPP